MNKRAVAVFVAVMLGLSGCGRQTEEADSAGETADTINGQIQSEESVPVDGGTMRFTMRIPKTLNPLVNEDSTVDTALKLLYEPLIAVDENYKPTPSLAESWSFSEDGRSLTIRLKDNIFWENGNPIVADDIVLSLRTIVNSSENSVYKGCAENLQSFSKLDDKTAIILFSTAYSANIYRMSFPLISSAYYGAESTLLSAKNMQPIGNGAFKFEEYTPGSQLKLLKNSTAVKGSPHIDQVSIQITQDEATDIYSFDRGLSDVISADVTQLGKYDNYSKTKVYEYTANYFDYVGFNFNNAIVVDKNMRKAIAYALPKQTMIESIYLFHAKETDTVLNPSSWLYEPDVQKYIYNTQHARILLEESGWIDTDNDSIREKTSDGSGALLQLRILANEENEERGQIAKRMAEELGAMGFLVTLDICSFEEYTQKLAANDFDIFIGGWQLSIVPDFTFMLGSNQAKPGGTNYARYSDAQADALLRAARDAVGEDAMKAAYSELQKYVAEEIPYLGIAYRNSALFAGSHLFGEFGAIESNVFHKVAQWYIKE